MNHWWRAYDAAIDHEKLLLLTDRQHRGWFNLMCLASANGGQLPEMRIMALKLRMSSAKVAGLLAELQAARLFDEVDGKITPHNWNSRQYKTDVTDPTNAERQQRYRDRHRVTDKTVTEGVTAKLPETEVETERKKDAGASAPHSEDADLFQRGKQVLGSDAGSLIAKLKKTKGGSIPLARAAIETAATKQNPREYIGRILTGPARAGPVLMENGQPYPDGII
jgi:hypothetical protein